MWVYLKLFFKTEFQGSLGIFEKFPHWNFWVYKHRQEISFWWTFEVKVHEEKKIWKISHLFILKIVN